MDGEHEDVVAVEEPLEIRVEGEPWSVLMRSPGHDRELAIGFLRGEGVIEDADDLEHVAVVAENVIDVRLTSGVEAHREALSRAQRTVSSACGICGRRTLDEVQILASGPIRPVEVDLEGLDARLRDGQLGFQRTGGLHGAALVGPWHVREDVGRHNAVDKVLGRDLLDRGEGGALVVSSRAGFEIVQKARLARLGAVIAFGAATTLAIDLAHSSGMQLYGFVGPGRFTRYS